MDKKSRSQIRWRDLLIALHHYLSLFKGKRTNAYSICSCKIECSRTIWKVKEL